MRIRAWVVLTSITVTLAAAPPLTANETTLPFVLLRGYSIVVKGSIGGYKGLNVIIDTGAVPSLVDTRLSRRLGLVGQADHVTVFARTVSAQRVVLPNVELGPIHAEGVEALAQDLSFIEKKLGVRIDALIGLDVLGRMNFSIDFAASRLRFDPTPDAIDVWANMTGEDYFAAVEVELNEVPVKLIVDTGVNHVILFESRAHRVYAKNRVESVNVSATIGGNVRLKEVESPLATMGNAPLALSSILILETPANLSLAIDGLLGVAALKPVRVEFNFERRAVGWKW